MKFLLRPWCWITGHLVDWTKSVTTSVFPYVADATFTCRVCGKQTTFPVSVDLDFKETNHNGVDYE